VSWPCTIRINKMGSMMEDEFNKYIKTVSVLINSTLRIQAFAFIEKWITRVKVH
jgi:hypothetical protein